MPNICLQVTFLIQGDCIHGEINQYAKLTIKSIAISDCAGTSDIIECEGSTRTLANITIDGGEY